MKTILISIILIVYTYIHILEAIVIPTRMASVMAKRIATGYSYSGAISTTTRFFMMALMPSIGYLVDKKIEKSEYLTITIIALLFAGIGTGIIYKYSMELSRKISKNYISKKEYFLSIIFFKFESIKSIKEIKAKHNAKLILQATIVYSIYSTSIFISFFLAIIFYEYRVTLSLLSGITNGFATVILNFLIEPYLANQIDKNSLSSVIDLQSMLLGRTIGTLIISQIIILLLWKI